MLKKKTILNLKTQIKYWCLCFSTKWSLYEMIPRRVYVNSGTTSYKKSLFEVTPMLLYEMVSFIRCGLCSKRSLYEVTWHLCDLSSFWESFSNLLALNFLKWVFYTCCPVSNLGWDVIMWHPLILHTPPHVIYIV